MEADELVQVKITTRTGQQANFSASKVEKFRGGYKFFSYPEKRGFLKMTLIWNDALASLSVEAPEPFFDSMKDPEPAAPPIEYPGGDPQTHVSALKVVREATRAVPLRTEFNTPASAVKLDGKDVVVGASMLGGVPK